VDELLRELVAVLVPPDDGDPLIAAARIDEPSGAAGLGEGDLRVRLDAPDEQRNRLTDLRQAERSGPPAVHENRRRRQRPRPDGVPQDVQSSHGLRRLRDTLGRSRCQLQREDRQRGGHEQSRAAEQECAWPGHDRAREPGPEAVLDVGPREARQRQPAPP
jgi:hypothetical protein